ncbi:MAG: AAA family ATPase, partial [Gemmatimonadetes bacterium]|nr:AAA family ATPase [Gemmatimonadota bacterium]
TAVRSAERDGTPVYVLRRGSREQIRQFLRRFGNGGGSAPPGRQNDSGVGKAMAEAEEGVKRVLAGEGRVELSPQAAHVRRLQHGLAARHNLASSSTGHDPRRRVVIRARGG